MRYNHHILFLFTLLVTSFVKAQNEDEIVSNSSTVTCVYKRKDTSVDLDIDDNVFIACDNRSCSVNGQGAVASYGYVNITDAGTYVIQGLLNGQLYIKAEDDDFVHVILNDATIFSRHGPAIYGAQAKKITVTSMGKSSLIDTDNYSYEEEEENKPDACLYAECDLSINGPGSLTVTGNYGDAIKGNKDIRLYGTTIIVPAAVKKGIRAKNSICIKDIDLDVISTDTGIMATGDEDNTEDGNILIDNGRVRVISGNEGIHAESHITINNSFVDVKENITETVNFNKAADTETVNVETIDSAEAETKEEEEDKETTEKKHFSLIEYIEKLFGFGDDEEINDDDDDNKEKEKDEKQEKTDDNEKEKEKEKDEKQEKTDDNDNEKEKDEKQEETDDNEKEKDQDKKQETQEKELEIDDSNMVSNGDRIKEDDEEEEDIANAEEEVSNNNNNNNNEENVINENIQDQVMNNTSYQLPKYFHFDIKREGNNSGNDEYK